MYKDVHFSATSFLSKTRRTFFLYGRPAHFHSLKKAEISFRGRKHPVQGSFFSPPKTPDLQLLFRHEVGNAVSSRVCGANSRSELRTDVQFRYRWRARCRPRSVLALAHPAHKKTALRAGVSSNLRAVGLV